MHRRGYVVVTMVGHVGWTFWVMQVQCWNSCFQGTGVNVCGCSIVRRVTLGSDTEQFDKLAAH